MRTPTYTPGSGQHGSAPNPSDDDYRRKFEEGNFDERINDTPTQGDIEKGIGDLENLANKQDSTDKPIQEQESDGGGSIRSTYTGKNTTKKIVGKAVLKKAAPFLGGGGIIGVIIFLIGGWLPTMLVPGLAQGSIAENDTRSTVLERRLLAKLKTKMADTSGPCATKTAICLNKKMPKNMLNSMANKGIVGLDGDSPVDTKGGGYVDKNPTHYQFTDSGGKLKTIAASEFLTEYKNNPVFRSTFKKAWNMRYVSYASNFMRKALNKWGVKPDGGKIADTEFTEKDAAVKTSEATKSGGDKLSEGSARETFKERAKLLLNRAADKVKKSGGDPVLAIGSAGCMAIGLPTFVAGTVRAIQLAQVMVLASDFVLSAGDMIRSGDATPEQTSALGNTLTGRYKDTDTNQLKSAVDSPILLAAAGAATQSVLKPNKYMPGYALFSNPTIKGFGSVSGATKEACNLINSPQAMVASAAVTGAIAGVVGPGTVLAAAKFALQGVTKALIALGGITLLMQGLEEAGVMDWVGGLAYDAAKDMVGNQYEDVKGKPFGDALGAGIFAVLSIGALTGGAVVLTKSEAGSFKKVSDATEEQYKQEDIATRSPLDVTSRYTFLGSIASNLAVSSAGSSNPVTSTLSTIGTIISSPFKLLGSSASAAEDPIEAKFGYASYYGVEDNIGVTVAGTPATGMPTEWIDMETTTAESLASNSYDPITGAPYEPSAALDMEGTFTGKNPDIHTTIADCAGADLESMSGCTIDPNDPAKSAAVHNYYMDYGLERVLNGEDAAEGKGGSEGTVADATIDMANIFEDSTSILCAPGTTFNGVTTGYTNKNPVNINLCELPTSMAVSDDSGKKVLVNSRVSGAALQLVTQMSGALGGPIHFSDSYRTMEEQQCLYGGGCGAAGPAAEPGTSNHQMGLAFDFSLPGGNSGRSRPGNSYWDWLTANAAASGYKQWPPESWHWSVTGG